MIQGGTSKCGLIYILGPTAYDLDGKWLTANGSWILCKYVSKTEATCNGSTLTLDGETVTWSTNELRGNIIKSGDKSYDILEWYDGLNWVKQGKHDTNNFYLF